MSSRILYQVGTVGTASGALRTTKEVAHVTEDQDRTEWHFYCLLSGDKLGYVYKEAEGYAAFGLDCYGESFCWEGTHEKFGDAIRAVMGKPGHGYTYYSFKEWK
jgi:hypothetical protein